MAHKNLLKEVSLCPGELSWRAWFWSYVCSGSTLSSTKTLLVFDFQCNPQLEASRKLKLKDLKFILASCMSFLMWAWMEKLLFFPELFRTFACTYGRKGIWGKRLKGHRRWQEISEIFGKVWNSLTDTNSTALKIIIIFITYNLIWINYLFVLRLQNLAIPLR